MENRIHQRRVSFSDTQSPKHHAPSGSRNDNASKTFHYDNMGDDEHVTSVAAAAFAIHSQEESELRNSQKMREVPRSSRTQTMRRKEDNISRRPSYGEISINSSFGQDPRTTGSASPVKRPSSISSSRPVPPLHVKTRPKTWEKATIEKIQKWYQKIKSKVVSWKCVKKNQAKLQRAMEHRRAIEKQNYGNKRSREYMIAQLEDKRRKQESEAREKANKIQKIGKVPVKCACFNS